jgi:hypothetical protein
LIVLNDDQTLIRFGLATARAGVNRHGGDILVLLGFNNGRDNSRVEENSTFAVTLIPGQWLLWT